jgi:hypothetical protein
MNSVTQSMSGIMLRIASLESTVKRWDRVTLWLALVGAALVLLSGITSFVFRGYSQELDSLKTEQARREKDASDKAIAEAGARAAEANARAEEANLELWRLKTPRSLSDSQRGLLVAELKSIGKYRLDVYALIPHDEVLGLQVQLVSIFNEAGWTAHSNPNRRMPQPGIVNGLVIEIAGGASPEIRTAATLVAGSLRKAGLQTSGPQSSWTMGEAPIEILVGPKP